jgi:hypothetical protein
MAIVSRLSPSLPVRKMCWLLSTGEDFPAGSDVFQTTLFLGPNSIGRALVEATPEALGPRKPGQLAAGNVDAVRVATTMPADSLKNDACIFKLLMARI